MTRLEAATALNTGARADTEAAADEFARLAQDRARLAAKLDAACARADRLAHANREVEARLVGLMDTVRKMAVER